MFILSCLDMKISFYPIGPSLVDLLGVLFWWLIMGILWTSQHQPVTTKLLKPQSLPEKVASASHSILTIIKESLSVKEVEGQKLLMSDGSTPKMMFTCCLCSHLCTYTRMHIGTHTQSLKIQQLWANKLFLLNIMRLEDLQSHLINQITRSDSPRQRN